MKDKLFTAEKWVTISCIIPLVAVFVVGIFCNKATAFLDIFTIIGLAVLGILLIIGTQILPTIRLWTYIRRVKSMVFYVIAVMAIYIAAYVYFFYDYAIMKSESQLALFILLITIASQRFYPTDKVVEKYIIKNPKIFPEETEKREEERQIAIEKEREERKKLEEYDAEREKRFSETPDFDEFFELKTVKPVESNVESVENTVKENDFTDVAEESDKPSES